MPFRRLGDFFSSCMPAPTRRSPPSEAPATTTAAAAAAAEEEATTRAPGLTRTTTTATPYKPQHAASSFLRTATPRHMKRANEIL
ncbi:hypothetical protein F5X99DRAFT_398248 [Biscogniauxia marginata]|nr:hypothetical protein F5X99DRAFT_398248 [Biscogniauxia marginata]